MDYLKLFTDWLHTPEGFITFVVIILTAISFVIAGIAIPALSKLILKTLQYLICSFKRGQTMFKNWRYWKKYHPNYEVNISDIQCKSFDNKCKLTIRIMVSITNKDDRTWLFDINIYLL